VPDELETTLPDNVQPLRVHDIPVFQTLPQIKLALQKANLSDEHLRLFANPNVDPATGQIKWRPSIGGEYLKLSDLPDDRQRLAVGEKLAQLVKDISDVAENLKSAGELTGQYVELALEIPDESHVFVVANQPVIAAWGHVPRGPPVPIKVLQKLAAGFAPDARITPETRIQGGGGGPGGDIALGRHRLTISPVIASFPAGVGALRWIPWLLWPLFVLLLLIIGYLLLKNCALAWPGATDYAHRAIFNFCAAPPMLRDESRQASLLDELRRLDRNLETRRNTCTPRPPREAKRIPPPVTQPPVVPPVTQPPVTQPPPVNRVPPPLIGAMNVILSWDTDDDLDLHVICPGGGRIYHAATHGCGGELNIDQNRNDNNISANPVENITWSRPPPGEYRVEVDRYKIRSSTSRDTDFTVELRINGERVETHSGQASGAGQPRLVFTFKIPYVRR
jgi:hypothetical protein